MHFSLDFTAKATGDLAYLLDREKGIHIFCDHANLVYIFAPDKSIKPHLRGKLQQWAIQMVGLRYVIEHISGEENVWGQRTLRTDSAAVTTQHIRLLQTKDDGGEGRDTETQAWFTRFDLSPA
ncbi:unnamed protein product [Phytophthora fragariaefolia]|uniref:Unnamed protein product n=1 Tax=Phytophthora fragariaefolia TaxID=1490495 RepID=A0A9W6XKM8_9STRA|nr:unnamed protein product [Phytophthora fragariaefolia]